MDPKLLTPAITSAASLLIAILANWGGIVLRNANFKQAQKLAGTLLSIGILAIMLAFQIGAEVLTILGASSTLSLLIALVIIGGPLITWIVWELRKERRLKRDPLGIEELATVRGDQLEMYILQLFKEHGYRKREALLDQPAGLPRMFTYSRDNGSLYLAVLIDLYGYWDKSVPIHHHFVIERTGYDYFAADANWDWFYQLVQERKIGHAIVVTTRELPESAYDWALRNRVTMVGPDELTQRSLKMPNPSLARSA